MQFVWLFAVNVAFFYLLKQQPAHAAVLQSHLVGKRQAKMLMLLLSSPPLTRHSKPRMLTRLNQTLYKRQTSSQAITARHRELSKVRTYPFHQRYRIHLSLDT